MGLIDDIKREQTEYTWWRPVRTDDAWLARLRGDYSEKASWGDEELRDYFDGHRKYATTWDHVGDAYDEWEKLSDRFFDMEAALIAADELAILIDELLETVPDTEWDHAAHAALADYRKATS